MVNLNTIDHGPGDNNSMIKPSIKDQLLKGRSPAAQPNRAHTPADEFTLAHGNLSLNKDLTSIQDNYVNPFSDSEMRISGHVNLNLPSGLISV